MKNIRVPYDVNMEVPMHSIHTDRRKYTSPETFLPFRFAQCEPRKPLVTLDETFLSFGHYRNGRQGRWFGAHFMKAMMAYVVLNLEV